MCSEAVVLQEKPASRGRTEWQHLRAFLELRHARLQLEVVASEIGYATELLSRGYVSPDGAMSILRDAIGEWRGFE
jgi:hypothetical protein